MRRIKLDISQEEVALRMDMDRGYYSQIESGKRNITLQTLRRIAEALETKSWVLLKEAEK